MRDPPQFPDEMPIHRCDKMLPVLVAKMNDERKLFSPVRVTPYTYIDVDQLVTSPVSNNYKKAVCEAFRILSHMKATHNDNLLNTRDLCLMLASKYDLNCSGCQDQKCPRWVDQFR